MGQRNMLCTSQMNDMEIDQQAQGYLCPDPCFLMPNFRQSSLDMHHFQEPYERAVFYGMPRYIQVQDHDLAVPATPNFYNAYAAAPSSNPGLIPVTLSHGPGPADQLPSSSNYAAFGVPADNGVAGPYKRKHAEGVPGSFQYYDSSASSSSSVAPFNTRHHPEGVAVMDGVSFRLPQFRSNGVMMEAGSQRSVTEPVQAQGHNHLIQGSYMGQPFQPSGTRWVNQQMSSNSSAGGAPSWTQSPPIPYMHGSNVNGGFMHPPPNHQHFNVHYPSPPSVQGARGHAVNIYPQVSGTSYRLPTNAASRSVMNPSQDGLEVDPRHHRPVPTTGHAIYRPHRGDLPEMTLRYRNLPHFRVFPLDEVAMLESPDLYQAVSSVDHHRDMRMDIEDMTYEDLLALEERIGNVTTGLSEEDVVKQMKTRIYAAPSVDEEKTDSCIICQDSYIDKEKIGTLSCGHEYHADCLKKWLIVKNVCPICKSEALGTGRKQA